MDKTSIYFLCTGNSCRSQMAEGFAKKYLGNNYEVLSAGIEARGIHPLAIKVMNEKGIDISDQTSDVVNVKSLNKADIVITLWKDVQFLYQDHLIIIGHLMILQRFKELKIILLGISEK